VIAVSPQTRRQNDFTVQQHSLPFPVLSDAGAQLADEYGVGYTVPESHRAYYQSILVNIPFVNSGAMYNKATEESWRLPVPAVFVIRRDGMVAFSEGYADFRVRPEPAEVLEALGAL
jgi:peroxiredoxin